MLSEIFGVAKIILYDKSGHCKPFLFYKRFHNKFPNSLNGQKSVRTYRQMIIEDASLLKMLINRHISKNSQFVAQNCLHCFVCVPKFNWFGWIEKCERLRGVYLVPIFTKPQGQVLAVFYDYVRTSHYHRTKTKYQVKKCIYHSQLYTNTKYIYT